MQPALWNLWKNPHRMIFVSTLVYCSMCSFMLGALMRAAARTA